MSSRNRTTNAVIVITITTLLCVIAIVTLVPYDHLQQRNSDRRAKTGGPLLIDSKVDDHCKSVNNTSKPTPVYEQDSSLIPQNVKPNHTTSEANILNSDARKQIMENDSGHFSSCIEKILDDETASVLGFFERIFIDYDSGSSTVATVVIDDVDIPADATNNSIHDINGVGYAKKHSDDGFPPGYYDDQIESNVSYQVPSAQGPEERNLSASHPNINSSSKSSRRLLQPDSTDIVSTFSSSPSCTPNLVRLYELRWQSPEQLPAYDVEETADTLIQEYKSHLKKFYSTGEVPSLDGLNKWERVRHLAPRALHTRVAAYYVKVEELSYIDQFKEICLVYKLSKENEDVYFGDYVRYYFECMIPYKIWKDSLVHDVRDYTEKIRANSYKDYIQLASSYVAMQIDKSIEFGMSQRTHIIRHFQHHWHFYHLQKAFSILDFFPASIQEILLKFEERVSSIDNCHFNRNIGIRHV